MCTSRFTKCCACHQICTSRFTKCSARHKISTLRVTKCCACHETCTSRFTCGSPDKALRSKNASKDNIQITKTQLRARRPPISENERHVEKSRLTAPVTNLECLHHVQSAAPPATKSALRSKIYRIPCTCHEKSTLDHPEVSLAPATTSDHHVRKCARHRNESTVVTSTRRGNQILRACAVEMHFEHFEKHECTVNSSELAGRPGATPRLDTVLNHYRKNP